MPARRSATVAVTWVLVVGLAWTAVALPERCPPVTPGQARTAAEEAVGWFTRNQMADGRWAYRYDRARDTVDPGPHVVRHSGVILSLYQADAAGIDGARAVADRGVAWSLGRTVRSQGWAAVRSGEVAPTGGAALLLSGLAVRRLHTGDDRYDSAMASLGRFLVTMTEPAGAVLAAWDTAARRPLPGVYSPFFTGEAYLALALLATVDGDGPWEATAQRIGRYLATDRDRAEDRFPPTSDHWAAYGLAELGLQGERPGLGPAEQAYAERLAAVFGVQVRFESQRTGSGLNRAVLRGPQALGAGLGTLGEGLGSLWRLAEGSSVLADARPVLGERLRCVAGMLVDRQVGEEEAAEAGRPGLARGAWFHGDVSQMDDQQHALSALLLAAPALAEGEGGDGGAGAGGPQGESSGDDSAGRVLWLAVVALAVTGPARCHRALGRAGPRPVAVGIGVATVALAGLAVVAAPLLRAASVSPPTALVAAGVVVAATALHDAVRPPRWRAPAPVPDGPGDTGDSGDSGDSDHNDTDGHGRRAPGDAGDAHGHPQGHGAGAGEVAAVVLRPALALLVVAVAGDVGTGAGLAAAAAGGAAGLAALLPTGGARPTGSPVGTASAALVRAGAALAVLGAVDLVADGVLAI